MRTLSISLSLCASSALFLAHPVPAQSLRERIAAAPDGLIRLEFPTRPGVCGDGKDMIGYQHALFSDSFESYGSWSNARCEPGPMRVSLTISGGKVVSMRPSVGGDWPQIPSVGTNLGTVSAAEASAYFFDLIPQLEHQSQTSRILLPAVLADVPAPLARLTALARDNARTSETRRRAIHWLGMLGDASVVPTLVSFAKGDIGAADNDDDRPGSRSLVTSAVAALSFIPDKAGMPALLNLMRDERNPNSLRKNALFWVGQSGDDETTKDIVAFYNSATTNDLREHAIFVLSQRKDDPALLALMHIATDDTDRRMRSRAMFWLGQKDDPRVTKLITDRIMH